MSPSTTTTVRAAHVAQTAVLGMDFRETTVEQLVGAVSSRQVSARDLTQAAISNLESLNARLNAFCAVNFEDALAQADAIDARLQHGDPAGPLAGIPIGVKDLEDARGFVTTFGAELHANDPPAQHDSVLVALLREAGCVILGKTNTPEFGFKGVTDNRPFGATRNPWNLDYKPRRVVWSPTMGFATVDSEIMQHCEAAVAALRGAGVDVVVRDTIWEEDPAAPWYQFWSASRARAQGDLRGTPQWDRIDDGLKPQIEHGMDNVSGVDYARALDACHYLNAKLVDAFRAGDFILTPTTCGQTPKAGSASGTIDGEQTDGWVAFTYGINMTRNPAGTVCVGKTGLGLPIGLQIIGNQRDDVGVLKTMCFLEDLLAQPHNAPVGVV